MERKVRTRFAPSPTGPLHMGGVRTALFAWLFARHHGGDFLLRIEDTDQNRYVPGAEDYIVEALKWCGITIDEGVSAGGPYAPYRQSERKELGIYKEYAEILLADGNAYYAFDTPEELDTVRKIAEQNGHSFSYDAATRLQMKNSLSLSKEETERKILDGDLCVIRLRVPENEEIRFHDMVRGEVVFPSSSVDDKVLLKSDGMPTYHLAHMVDDYLMEITHAIRGEEWLPSAPAHVLLYHFLGWTDKMPRYAHLPLLLKPEGNGKLSKRDGDKLGFPVFPLEWKDPVSGEISSGYREKGYYPEAFVNMLALLGWNPGSEQEIFSMDELSELFSFDHVHKGGARFDPEKTKWFNEQYLRAKNDEDLAFRLREKAKEKFKLNDDDARLTNAFLIRCIRLLKDRVQFEHELVEKGSYLFIAPSSYDEAVISKKWKPAFREFFMQLKTAFSGLGSFSAVDVEATFKETAEANSIKPGEVLQLLRVILSGQAGGVDLFGMIELLGNAETCRRIENGLKALPS
jgi:glutamyl-tRNA synthetase